MLYCGIFLHADSFKITILTDGFAHLSTKYFKSEEYETMHQLIGSFQLNNDECCSWFFDEKNFNDKIKCASIFNFNEERQKIYLVNHRKLANMLQFLREWIIETEIILMCEIDTSFILASSIRLFDCNDMGLFKL